MTNNRETFTRFSSQNQTIDDKSKIIRYVDQLKAASANQDPEFFISDDPPIGVPPT